MNNYAGAFCEITDCDHPTTEGDHVYISFGEYDDETGEHTDPNDVLEGLVYYYATPDEWEQLRTGAKVEGVDFVVIPSTIDYHDKEGD